MNSSGTIVFKAGQLKHDLEILSQRKSKKLSVLLREILEDYIEQQQRLTQRKQNFMSRFRGVEKLSQSEADTFIADIKQAAQFQERTF